MTSRVTNIRRAGQRHAVVTIASTRTKHAYRRQPCAQCPWRRDQVGAFPAEAFRLSAPTCYDAAFSAFGCHMSGARNVSTCAGFLLSDSAIHNVLVRIAQADKGLKLDRVGNAGLKLFTSYRTMAIANGVDADDPVLTPIRDRTTKVHRRPRDQGTNRG